MAKNRAGKTRVTLRTCKSSFFARIATNLDLGIVTLLEIDTLHRNVDRAAGLAEEDSDVEIDLCIPGETARMEDLFSRQFRRNGLTLFR